MIRGLERCSFCGGGVIYDPRTGYGVCSSCGSLTEDRQAYQYSYSDITHSSPISRGADRERRSITYEDFIEDVMTAILRLSSQLGIPGDAVWSLAMRHTEIWSGRMSKTIAEVFALAHCIISGNTGCVEAIRSMAQRRFKRLVLLARYVERAERGEQQSQ